MIQDKTASLLGASCKLGFISNSNGDNKEHIQKFGEYLGNSPNPPAPKSLTGALWGRRRRTDR